MFFIIEPIFVFSNFSQYSLRSTPAPHPLTGFYINCSSALWVNILILLTSGKTHRYDSRRTRSVVDRLATVCSCYQVTGILLLLSIVCGG